MMMADPVDPVAPGVLDNAALLALVAQYGTAGYALLFDQFGDLCTTPARAHSRFYRRLERLLDRGALVVANGSGRDRVFCLGTPRRPLAPTPQRPLAQPPLRPSAFAPAPDAAVAPQRVPAPAYNAMAAPVYVPAGNSAALRPGALDYRRYPSRGQRC